MCGRYYRKSDKQRIAEAFDLGELDELLLEAAPSYNVAPTTNQPVILNDHESGQRKLEIMRWGLIPFWTKDDPRKLGISTINAKAETLLEKQTWKQPFLKRRCLVPADGYYEWQKVDAKTKQPYAFGLKDGSTFAFAGLWERWKAPDGHLVHSFAIVTTEANELGAPVHARMPVILHSADYDRWLGECPPEQPPVDLLRTLPANEMSRWPVSSAVGNARNNDPSLCAEAISSENHGNALLWNS
jgi:putative SOS response-associated peptidase YedK